MEHERYKVDVLRDICREYIAAEDWAWQVNRMEKKSRDYWDRSASEACNNWFSALKLVCKMIGADMDTVVAIEKSIRRNTQYKRHWESEPHFSWWNWDGTGTEDSYRKAIKAE